MKIGILYEVSEDAEEYPGESLDDTATRKKRKRPKLDREEVFAARGKLDHCRDIVAVSRLENDLSSDVEGEFRSNPNPP